ncbi:DUF2846 domain-containing protein [Bradyrhizobium ontarionense]|uniref:DUF2846 domain-containing protein n=1 Tax=Bradyrhizobium ontarionense TaxID=2898149 RepID=A0ABY3RG86_9BRAD|nr:DUF2846 domain-containing protein [Bradyrhizobium sp. A19]UFZ06012.1 DUF2846 domain-containing protein [Bradyrhizobium sp. A19]
MNRRAFLGLGSAFLVSGCLTGKEGTEYAVVSQKIGSPRPGHSRIVIMSLKDSWLDRTSCDAKVDGVALSRLLPGTYVYLDRPAGPHHLVATQTLFPGDSILDFNTEPGRTYFFSIRPSDRSRAMQGGGMAFGLVGMGVMAAASSGADNKGPVDFVPLQESQAKTVLTELLQAE